MTPGQAIAFVRKHGVVLESARGPVPSLAAAIAGEPIQGNWWSHPRSHEIFALTQAVRDCADVLVCRVVGGKVSFVHRELWPALVRLAGDLPQDRLAQLEEEHTASGRHVLHTVPYPKWVPREVAAAARGLDEAEARARLGPCLERPPQARRPARRRG